MRGPVPLDQRGGDHSSFEEGVLIGAYRVNEGSQIQLKDELSYEYSEGRNILKMKKKLRPLKCP